MASITCEKYKPLLSGLLDRELRARQSPAVTQHVAGCAECQTLQAAFQSFAEQLRAQSVDAAKETDFSGFSQAVMRRLPTIEKSNRLGWLAFWSPTYGFALASSFVAAAVIAVVGIPTWLGRSATPLGYASAEMKVDSIQPVPGGELVPVKMDAGGGNTIIWAFDSEEGGGGPGFPTHQSIDGSNEESKL